MGCMTIEDQHPIDFFSPEAPYPASAWPSPNHSPNPMWSPTSQSAPTPAPPPKKRKSLVPWAVAAFLVAALAGGLLAYNVSKGSTSAATKATSTTVTTAQTATTLSPTKSTPATTVKGVASTAPAATAPASGKLAQSGPPLDIHALIAKVGPSVVSIEIFQGSNRVAAGSGVVVSDDGLIVTNAHVVSLTDQFGRTLRNPAVKIRLSDGTERAAKILGSQPDKDIALVKVDDTASLKAAEIGDSNALQVGDDVVAIGNALDLGATPTVTKGIISAKDRELEVDVNLTLTGLLQTDAAINHGNSGGALVNASGQVIGINSAGIPDAQNLGFAIASQTFQPLIEKLKSAPPIAARPLLGVTATSSADGLVITAITPKSGAEAAGIQDGDLIVAVDGKPITTENDLKAAIGAHKPGETIQVTYDRSGQKKTVTATLGS
jgi:S1-C subfamily serine protease